MSEEYSFRPYKKSDHRKIASLIDSANLLSTYLRRGIFRSVIHWLGIYSNYLFVMEETKNHNIIGTIVLSKRISSTLDSFKWWMYAVYIHDDYQGKKLGEKLVDHALTEQLLRNVHEVFLYVQVRNDKAINLYLKKDFKIAGIRRLQHFDSGYRLSSTFGLPKVNCYNREQFFTKSLDMPWIFEFIIRIFKAVNLIEVKFFEISNHENDGNPAILYTLRIGKKYRYYIYLTTFDLLRVSLLQNTELAYHAEIFIQTTNRTDVNRVDFDRFGPKNNWMYVMKKVL